MKCQMNMFSNCLPEDALFYVGVLIDRMKMFEFQILSKYSFIYNLQCIRKNLISCFFYAINKIIKVVFHGISTVELYLESSIMTVRLFLVKLLKCMAQKSSLEGKWKRNPCYSLWKIRCYLEFS